MELGLQARHQWLTLVILGTWETGWWFEARMGKVYETLISINSWVGRCMSITSSYLVSCIRRVMVLDQPRQKV
jgi:hypothetical protein